MGGRGEVHSDARARHTHTQFTMTLLGRRAGTACWLASVVTETLTGLDFAYSRQLSQARPRTASTHSLFDRYMKAQLRLAGGRRKPGRHGFSSDTPRGSLALPYICATCATCDPKSTLPSLRFAHISARGRTGAPGRSQASRMNLPECQQPPVKACSKDAPDRPPIRGGWCMWRPHNFSSGVT